MSDFSEIRPAAFDGAFGKIGEQWMLISVRGKDEKGRVADNTMTASWGGLGVLWNFPVVFCFVRKSRYTLPLMKSAPGFSLSFLPEAYRDSLRLCGRISGRDTDKFAAAELTKKEENDIPYIEEAGEVVFCQKLYEGHLEKEGFCLPELLKNYPGDDFHDIFVGRITKVLKRNDLL